LITKSNTLKHSSYGGGHFDSPFGKKENQIKKITALPMMGIEEVNIEQE